MTRGRYTGKYADVPLRVKSWGYIVMVFAVMLVHPLSCRVVTVLLSLYAIREYFTMTGVKSKALLYTACGFGIPVFLAMYSDNYTLFVGSVAVCMGVLFVINRTFRVDTKYGHVAAGVALCIFSIGHLAFIRTLEYPQQQICGVKLLVFLVVVIELNDVFQYLTGKAFGKRKITPHISPNKTVEGFWGGIALSILLSNLIGWFLVPHKGVLFYTVCGVVLALSGLCGDVLMSLIKRKNGVKDTGTLIPGHGGLLDRMDSLLLILPIFYWGIRALYCRL